ncbi:hypothetical protein CALVIDRAFT_562216 [Calocera viscosa TUFC12733]|uniref:Uncharacterized protein n=1 Tax=Calocera viscosa (strain TUFC12733) TaxID=1330018 RepID=A0A167P0N0_CALVF|nr:hypothetical protein CALVIDRAFT_562216 [Calocera viscosa TUFC12733]
MADDLENQTHIDEEYVFNAPKPARDSYRQQHLVYYPQRHPRSSVLSLRSKGDIDLALSQLGYDETIVFHLDTSKELQARSRVTRRLSLGTRHRP